MRDKLQYSAILKIGRQAGRQALGNVPSRTETYTYKPPPPPRGKNFLSIFRGMLVAKQPSRPSCRKQSLQMLEPAVRPG